VLWHIRGTNDRAPSPEQVTRHEGRAHRSTVSYSGLHATNRCRPRIFYGHGHSYRPEHALEGLESKAIFAFTRASILGEVGGPAARRGGVGSSRDTS